MNRRLAAKRVLVVAGLCLLGALMLLGIAVYLDVIERRGLPDPLEIFFAIILVNVIVIGGGLWFIRGLVWIRAPLYGPERDPLEGGFDEDKPNLEDLLRAEERRSESAGKSKT